MAREGYFKNWKNISQISFGLVYIGFTLWLIFHTKQFVPEGFEDFWWMVFISYGLLNAMIFGSADIRNQLFSVKFFKSLPRFFIFFGLSLFGFYILLSFFDPIQSNFFTLLENIPLWLACIHALVFATTESAIWQGFLDHKIGHPWSELSAGVFHYGIWSGGAVVIIISATLLFAFFSLTNWYFRKNKTDIIPVIAIHTAFNFVKLALLLS